MPEAIVQLKADDFEDALDFINLIFSVYRPINFQTLLPKLYKPTDEHMGWNYAIKRNGKIRALIGLYPIELNIGDTALKGAGIGAVAAHPNDKGQGHMKRLMQFHLNKMKSENYQLSWLAGQRQRYGYFGYEVCGCVQTYLVSKSNVRHAYKDVAEFEFEQITETDDERLALIKQWHENSPIHVTRPLDSLLDVFNCWHHELYAAMNGNKFVGYICADNKDGLVLEMGGASNKSAKALVPAWMNFQDNNAVTFEQPALPDALSFELNRISETQTIRSNGSWQIFDWPAVINAALRLKQQTATLVDGRFCLNIENYGTIELLKNGEDTSCLKTNNAPDLSVDALTAHRLLFGPLSPALSGLSKNSILNSWCPLPLFMPRQDEV